MAVGRRLLLAGIFAGLAMCRTAPAIATTFTVSQGGAYRIDTISPFTIFSGSVTVIVTSGPMGSVVAGPNVPFTHYDGIDGTAPTIDPNFSVGAGAPLSGGGPVVASGTFTTCGTFHCDDVAMEQATQGISPTPEPLTFGVSISPSFSFTATITYSQTPYVPPKSLGDCDCQPGGASVGNPINPATGNKYETAVDYRTSGQNPLSFVRYYNSAAAPDVFAADLGSNWRSNFDRFLHLNGGQVLAERPDGRIVTFIFHTGPTYTTDSDVDMTLSLSGSTWTLTDSDDTVETYTTNGSKAVLNSIRARNGYTQTLTYNGSNQLTGVTDSYGRSLSFTYANGVLNTLATPDGLVLTYSFASTGLSGSALDQLTGVAYSTGPASHLTYVYEDAAAPMALTGIVDENGGRFATWSYDSIGRAISSQHAGGADLTTLAYNGDGSTTVTNALGVQEVYKFATLQGAPKVTEIDRLADGAVAAATELFTYDGNGYLASKTDWNGNKTTYVNDARGQVLTLTEAAGTAQQRVTTTTYLANFRLPAQIVGPLATVGLTYDANGELLTRSETDSTVRSLPYSTEGQTRVWTFTWSNALLATAKSPRSAVPQPIAYGYDASGALISATDPLGHVTRITAHLPGGLPLTIVGVGGATTNLTYDARNRLLSSTVEGGVPLTTSFAYDAAGNLIKKTQPDGSALSYSYDAAHRLVAIADLAARRIVYTLDALGDRTQTQILGGAGVVRRTGSATFDGLGRTLQTIGGAGQTTSYTYDSNGNRLTTTEPRGFVTRQVFDALDRPIQITQPNGAVTTLAYDQLDRVAAVTDPNGNQTSYVHDGFGELIEEVSPDRGSTIYTYNAGGLQTQAADAAGNTVNRVYDGDDRVASLKYPNDPAENVALTYDQGVGGVGHLTGVTDQAGTLALAYNLRGLLTSAVRTHGAAAATTRYTYDNANRAKTLTYPSGLVLTYTRDDMGRVTAIAAQQGAGPSSPVVSVVAYAPYGPVTALTYGDGSVETRTLDPDYRLTALVTPSLQNLTYSYDPDDNVTAILDGIAPARSETLAYNKVNRLNMATGAYGAITYTYDLVGNRLTGTTVGAGIATQRYTYLPHSNRLAASSQNGSVFNQFTYAANGKPTADARGATTDDFTYNQANRLAAVQQGATTIAHYSYDAFGQRLVKALIGATTLYTYDQAGRPIEEDDISTGSAVPIADYIYLDDRPVGLYLAGKGLLFYHDDRLGTPQLVTDGSRNPAWAASYQPFGAAAIVASITQNLRLPGQYFDAELGWSHNGFRTYIQGIGRYLEPDPLGLEGGLAPYAYADGNPLKFTDRLGLDGGGGGFTFVGPGYSTPAGSVTYNTDGTATFTAQAHIPILPDCTVDTPGVSYTTPDSDALAPLLYHGSTPYNRLNYNPYEGVLDHYNRLRQQRAFNAAHPVKCGCR